MRACLAFLIGAVCAGLAIYAEATPAETTAGQSTTRASPASRPSQPPLSKEQVEVAQRLGLEPVIDVDLRDSVSMKMVLIPAGTFTMGSPDREKDRSGGEIQREVRISKPFYMGVTEVTQEQWKAVLGTDPSYFKGPTKPVTRVSWEECEEFLRTLNTLATGGGYRLPTEAEWEYACRAGTKTAFYYGDDDSRLGEYAWYEGNSERAVQPVGRKRPNPWGLYDLYGNVWEYCSDRYGRYPKGEATDPAGAATGTSRVLRGGSWSSAPKHCRSAARAMRVQTSRSDGNGFRCARTVIGVPGGPAGD
jgi:formylglycine-generating enzyme required for sulfatase activity